MNKNESTRIATEIAQMIAGDVFSDILHRVAFSTDASIYRIVPVCVVAPKGLEEIVAVVKYAAANEIAIAPRGAGSGVAGESLCSGIVLDMTRYMKRIDGPNSSDNVIVCEPGIVLDDVNTQLAGLGRKIGPDPSSSNRATIGGCVANNATGAHSLVYGHFQKYVQSIEAILSDGSVVQFKNDIQVPGENGGILANIAGKCKKLLDENEQIINKAMPKTKRNRSGYNIAGLCHNGRIDMARLLAASEGTLAIFSRIGLSTVELPKSKGLLQLEFKSLKAMAEAVPIIVETGVTACELMDKQLINLAIDSLPEYKDLLPENAAAVLLVEHVGDKAKQVQDKIEATDKAVGRLAAGRNIILDEKAQARVWKSRKDAGPLLYRKRRREHPAEFMEDTSVEHTKLGQYIEGLEKIKKKYDIEMSYFGHAGDGELHLRPYLDLGDLADVNKMRAIADDVFSLVWSFGGSISGEHADGLVRAGFVRRQYGDEYYNVLRKVKEIFDPIGIMNPGKILNDDPDIMVKYLRREKRILPAKMQGGLLFRGNELELELEQCYGCGLCVSKDENLRMCPVYRALGDELGSSRAKVNILSYWASGQLDDSELERPEFRKFLDLCVNCKACHQQCPSGTDVSMLMAAARSEYVKRKSLRRPEFVLSHNRYLSRLGSLFAPVSNFFMGIGPFKWFLELAGGIDKRRAMPSFKRGSFIKAGRKYLEKSEPITEPIDRVAYFVDTYANYNDHELGFAVLDVLRHNNIEVIIPDQKPAPLPAIVYGDVKTAKKDLAYNVQQLSGAVKDGYKIICSEPSAALCLQEELRHYVAGEEAESVSENTYELMNYLNQLWRQGKLKVGQKKINDEYSYHLPCHLCAIGSDTVTLELLEQQFGVKVTDLGAGCCGLSGTFGMQKKNYQLASDIGASLKQAIDCADTDKILTECAACKMQIEHLSKCTTLHPVKIIAQAYGLI